MFTRNSVRPVITIFMLCCFIGVAAESTAADRRSVYDRIDKKGAAQAIDPIFDLLDENGDLRVDRAEFRVWIVGAFEMYDVNKDNALSRSELPTVSRSQFDKADHSNDDRLSAFEFSDSDFMKFSRFDLNRDGFVTYE